MEKGNSATKGRREGLILEMDENHEGITPKVTWDMHLNQ